MRLKKLQKDEESYKHMDLAGIISEKHRNWIRWQSCNLAVFYTFFAEKIVE